MTIALTKEDRLLIEEKALAAVIDAQSIEEVDLLRMAEESGGFSFGDAFDEIPFHVLDEANAIIARVFYLHTEAKTYKVGGAVRDTLMGVKPKDTDYVVVGGTVDRMVEHGFQQVGAAFPVFLHPITGDEYALARRERKTGDGYHGFSVDFGAHITLEEDLLRRDFTTNSIAYDVVNAEIIDPYNGRADINSGCLRMVNGDAFKEDPLRTVRALRFAARYPRFYINGETFDAMRDVVQQTRLDELPDERFWAELEKVYRDAETADNIILFWKGVHDLELTTNTNFFRVLHNITADTDPHDAFNSMEEFTKLMFDDAIQEKFPEFTWKERLQVSIVFAANRTYGNQITTDAFDLVSRYDALAGEIVKQANNTHKIVETDIHAPMSETVRSIATVFLALRLYQADRAHVAKLLDYGNACAGADKHDMFQNIAKEWSQVNAENFPNLTGKELGAAIKEKRVQIFVNHFCDVM